MALSDLLKLAHDNWDKRDHIFRGIANNIGNQLGVLSEEKREIIKERVAICDGCDENSYKKPYDLQNPIYRDIALWHCDQCGCVIPNKTACFDNDEACECPLKKWLRYNGN